MKDECCEKIILEKVDNSMEGLCLSLITIMDSLSCMPFNGQFYLNFMLNFMLNCLDSVKKLTFMSILAL